MIHRKIYKAHLKKAVERLYNLGGKPLIALQEKYVKIVQKMLDRWYLDILAEIKDNPEIKINDLLIDQKQFINKAITNTDLEEYSQMMTSGFNIGAKQLNEAFKKDIKIDGTFGVDPEDALNYANAYAGARVSGVEEVAKKRINELVSQGIEKGRGYEKLSKAIRVDFAFSGYRANLIASHEIGEAYLRGKERQFERYRQRFNQTGWKNWISHRDSRTTEGCLHNDDQGWIPFDEEFQSGDMAPTRFPGCRCNIAYSLFKPDDDNLTPENAKPFEEAQSYLPEDWNEGMKPENYETYSTKILPASYYNEIGVQATYSKPRGRAYYRPGDNTINLGTNLKNKYAMQQVEAHEAGHFFLTKAIFPNETRRIALGKTMSRAITEIKEFVQDKDMQDLFSNYKFSHPVLMAQAMLSKYKDLGEITGYAVTAYQKTKKRRGIILNVRGLKMEPELGADFGAFLDTIGAITMEIGMGKGHKYSYYADSKRMFEVNGKIYHENQVQEFFAHLNEVFWVGNPITKKFLPETHKAMKEFYNSIGLEFIN